MDDMEAQIPTFCVVSEGIDRSGLSSSHHSMFRLYFFFTLLLFLEQQLHPVLRRIDVLQARGVKGDKFDKEINKADLEHLFNSNSSSSSGKHNGKNNNKDHISHYILRMAYCQNEELRRWFLTNECILFKIRFESAKSSDVDQFLRERKLLLKYPPVSCCDT